MRLILLTLILFYTPNMAFSKSVSYVRYAAKETYAATKIEKIIRKGYHAPIGIEKGAFLIVPLGKHPKFQIPKNEKKRIEDLKIERFFLY